MSHYEDCILFLLSKAFQNAHGNFKRRLQEFGLTPAQNLVVLALWEQEGRSAGELGKKLLLDNATVSGILDRLAESGWIVKKTSHDDRRALQIYLTTKAKDSVTSLKKVRDETNEEILSPFKIEEKLLLKRMLKDLQK